MREAEGPLAVGFGVAPGNPHDPSLAMLLKRKLKMGNTSGV